MLCPLEPPIPPEAPSARQPVNDQHAGTPPPHFEHNDPNRDLSWDPDAVSPNRLSPSESLQLETRGVTQRSPPPHPRHPDTTTQLEIWRKQTIHKQTIAAKLREARQPEVAAALELCHSYYTVIYCSNCGTARKFPNRCDRFYCPECQVSLSIERKKQVEWWTREIQQPKHVVLTVANLPELHKAHVQELRRWFTLLRRRLFTANWRGGFYSIEVTNEGRGWHLHIHALVDARWIDASRLAQEWSSVTHGFGRIVKVKDCRGESYLAEVTKYAVKGSQLATWTPDQISTFIMAFTGVRTFGVFGTLYGLRTTFAEWLETIRELRKKCDCDNPQLHYYSEADWLVFSLGLEPTPAPRPPPKENTPDIPNLVPARTFD